MARPKLLEDATKLNLTLEREHKRKLCALAADNTESMSQVISKLIDAAPNPSRAAMQRAQIKFP